MAISRFRRFVLALPLLGAAAVVVALWATEKPRIYQPPDEASLTPQQQLRLDELEHMGLGGLQPVSSATDTDALERLDDYERRRLGIIDRYFDVELPSMPANPPNADPNASIFIGDTPTPVVYVLGLLGDPAAAPNPLTVLLSPDKAAAAAEVGTLSAARAEALKHAQDADISIELDTPMEVGRNYQVTLIMQGRTGGQPAAEFTDLQAAVAAPTALAEEVTVSDELHAQLSTADFKVTELKGGWQSVVPEAATLWTWTVTPLSEGQKSMLFILEQRIATANSSYVVPVRNYPRQIAVQVNPMQFLYDAGGFVWSNLVTTLLALATIAGGLLATVQLIDWRRKKRLEAAATEVAVKPRKRKSASAPASKD